MISTISYDQQEIISNIILLHVPKGKIDLDCTYSKGVFYKDRGIAEPMFKSDINPLYPDVTYADSRKLPFIANTLGSVMFDPPFLATKGPSLEQGDGNLMAKRFSVFPTEKELHQYYFDTMKEIHRVLKDKGILIFKCQDKVSSGKQYFSHNFIHDKAVELGYYPKDLFILLAKSRIVAGWQKNQKHARKFHSYFWVFQKSNKKIDYGV